MNLTELFFVDKFFSKENNEENFMDYELMVRLVKFIPVKKNQYLSFLTMKTLIKV